MRGNTAAGAGFTLIEVLVAISIIGILLTVTSFNFNIARNNAQDRLATVDLEQVQLALTLVKEATGSYPDTTTSGIQEIAAADGSNTDLEAALYPRYLDELPSASTLYYESDGDEYCIGTALRRAVNQPDFHYSECITSDGTGVTFSVSDLGAGSEDEVATLGNYRP